MAEAVPDTTYGKVKHYLKQNGLKAVVSGATTSLIWSARYGGQRDVFNWRGGKLQTRGGPVGFVSGVLSSMITDAIHAIAFETDDVYKTKHWPSLLLHTLGGVVVHTQVPKLFVRDVFQDKTFYELAIGGVVSEIASMWVYDNFGTSKGQGYQGVVELGEKAGFFR